MKKFFLIIWFLFIPGFAFPAARTDVSVDRKTVLNFLYSLAFLTASSQYVQSSKPSYSNTEGMAIEMYIYLPEIAVATDRWYSEGSSSSNTPFISFHWMTISPRVIQITKRDDLSSSENLSFANIPLNLNCWQHVVVSDDVDNLAMSVFLNGVQEKKPYSNGTGTMTLNQSALAALWRMTVQNYSDIHIALLRAYSRPLEISEAIELYRHGIVPDAVAKEYLFSEGPGGSTLADTSGNGYDGTLISTPDWTTSVPSKNRTESALRTDIGSTRI